MFKCAEKEKRNLWKIFMKMRERKWRNDKAINLVEAISCGSWECFFHPLRNFLSALLRHLLLINMPYDCLGSDLMGWFMATLRLQIYLCATEFISSAEIRGNYFSKQRNFPQGCSKSVPFAVMSDFQTSSSLLKSSSESLWECQESGQHWVSKLVLSIKLDVKRKEIKSGLTQNPSAERKEKVLLFISFADLT